MGHNKAGENRKRRLKRRNKEFSRLENRFKDFNEFVTSIFILREDDEIIFCREPDEDTEEYKLDEPMPYYKAVYMLMKGMYGSRSKTLKGLVTSPLGLALPDQQVKNQRE